MTNLRVCSEQAATTPRYEMQGKLTQGNQIKIYHSLQVPLAVPSRPITNDVKDYLKTQQQEGLSDETISLLAVASGKLFLFLLRKTHWFPC
jgi:hypothetical protein